MLIRRGYESVVTDLDGSYRLLGATNDSVQLDPTSLRVGLITGAVRQVGDRREIAVIAVSPVEIELLRSGDDLVQADTAALGAVVVLARDDDGKVWVARRSSANIATFDALPSGHYTVEVDLVDLQEKLETRQVVHTFTVNGTKSVAKVKINLFARPVNVKRLDAVPPASDTPRHQP